MAERQRARRMQLKREAEMRPEAREWPPMVMISLF